LLSALLAFVALVNADAFGCRVAPTWPTITAGQDPLSVDSPKLSTTELRVVKHLQALGLTHARSA